MNFDGDIGAASGWLFGLVWLFFLVALVGGIVALIFAVQRGSSSRQRPESSSPSPIAAAEEILAERFARGEIDEEEYNNRRAALRGS